MKYTKDGHWLRPAGGSIQVGLTPQLIENLGSVIFVDLAISGTHLERGADTGVVEAEKTVFDVVMPLTGVISNVNNVILSHPRFVSDDPLGQGWLFELVPHERLELQHLLEEAEYLALTAAQ